MLESGSTKTQSASHVRCRSTLRKLLREPLLHFVLIGTALFLLFEWKGSPASIPGVQAGSPATQIVVNREAIEQMNSVFTKTWQRPPTDGERRALIEDFVRSEIYVREAIAIGLDRDDDVIKRRLRQKMEFIYENITSLAEPTEGDLKAFMQAHREKYLTAPQMAFRQVFLNARKRGAAAESDARQLLAELARGADPETLGDPTLLEADFPLSPLWDITKQFGEDFGAGLLGTKPRVWAGPIKSGLGLHLVFVRERREGRLADLNEVREQVKRDWMVEKQKELKDAAYVKLRERYSVTVEGPKEVTAPLAAAPNPKVIQR